MEEGKYPVVHKFEWASGAEARETFHNQGRLMLKEEWRWPLDKLMRRIQDPRLDNRNVFTGKMDIGRLENIGFKAAKAEIRIWMGNNQLHIKIHHPGAYQVQGLQVTEKGVMPLDGRMDAKKYTASGKRWNEKVEKVLEQIKKGFLAEMSIKEPSQRKFKKMTAKQIADAVRKGSW